MEHPSEEQVGSRLDQFRNILLDRMSSASIGDTIRQLALPKFGRQLDYKEKLERQTRRAREAAAREADVTALLDEEHSYAERMRALAEREKTAGVAFQSVVVAVLQVIDRVRCAERQAAEASISLGQREALDEMTAGLDATSVALRGMLSQQGEKMHNLSTACRIDDAEPSWWFALSEAIETVERAIECVTSIVSSQPKGCASRMLSSIVARQLRGHHHALLGEANEWMG